jgi:selenocysteine lyase/cysteine desulfurase
MLAPFGVGVLYAREHLLDASLPFLHRLAGIPSVWPRRWTGPGWQPARAATAPRWATMRSG